MPGPVRPDQLPLRIDRPVIFAFEQSAQGIIGIGIGGATLSADQIRTRPYMEQSQATRWF